MVEGRGIDSLAHLPSQWETDRRQVEFDEQVEDSGLGFPRDGRVGSLDQVSSLLGSTSDEDVVTNGLIRRKRRERQREQAGGEEERPMKISRDRASVPAIRARSDR